MTEKEAQAQNVAGWHYGLSLDQRLSDGRLREHMDRRMDHDERKAFDAGWEAAKQYYTNVQNQS